MTYPLLLISTVPHDNSQISLRTANPTYSSPIWAISIFVFSARSVFNLIKVFRYRGHNLALVGSLLFFERPVAEVLVATVDLLLLCVLNPRNWLLEVVHQVVRMSMSMSRLSSDEDMAPNISGRRSFFGTDDFGSVLATLLQRLKEFTIHHPFYLHLSHP